MLQMNVNKKLLQQELVQETGNVILLKDLMNIASATKSGRSRNDLDVITDTLMKHYGKCTCWIFNHAGSFVSVDLSTLYCCLGTCKWLKFGVLAYVHNYDF